MYRRILVPIDGSEISRCGLKEAIKIASSQQSQLRLLHVANERTWACNDGEGTHGGDFIESTPEDGRHILGEAVTLARHCGIEPETVLVESKSGPAAAQIVLQAKEWPADLIVMGTHGRRGLRRLAMGSDAECVVRNTVVPVLLVRGESVRRPTVSTDTRVADNTLT